MPHVISHPLASHVLTHLRDQSTHPATFRTLSYQIGLLLALEATRDLPVEAKAIETPLESMESPVLGQGLVVVPILRAGLGMLQPYTDLFPEVSVGYVGLERDHATAVAHSYYCKLPPMEGRRVLCVDPMLATGGSAAQALTVLKENGAQDLHLVTIVSAPEGVAAIEAQHPDVPIITAAIDRQLNDKSYILPGLGDYGDRLYGT
jgi:uracil phosphoribosyltransferase